MLVEAPLGNLVDEPVDPGVTEAIDWLDLSWSDCFFARALRRKTRSGRPLRILLRLGTTLRHGDILRRRSDPTDTPEVAVNLLPCAVLVAQPSDDARFASAAYELGNLHVPVQVLDGRRLLTIPDGPVEAALNRLGIAHEVQVRRFEPSLRGPGTLVPATDMTRIVRQS